MPPRDRKKRRPRREPQDTGPARRGRWEREIRGISDQEVFEARDNASATRAAVEELQAHAPPVLGGANWTPLGPAAVIRGQARTRPTVSGRILSMEVGPLGARAYVAAADGGVWQYDKVTIGAVDHDVWTPVDDFVMSASLVNLASGNSLAASSLVVQFGANARADTIFAGTGEPGALWSTPVQLPRTYYGVGVRVSPGAAGGPRVWHTEANNLRGQAIYRLFQDPDNPAILWAASSAGLFVRPTPSGPNVNWTQIASGGANQFPAAREVTDVVITGTTAAGNKAIFAAVDRGGVYRSTDNGTTWALIPIFPASAANPGRIALTVSTTANQIVYRFDSLGRLWRFDGVRLRRVQTLPPAASLVGTQGWYDLAVAVQPGTDDTVYVAGSLLLNDEPGQLNPANWDAAVYRSALTVAAPERRFNYAHGANPDRSPLWIGAGIHPDVHSIAFARDAAGNLTAGQVWVGCDGGVFRSPDGTPGSFRPVNESLAITQPTYFDHHPTSDAIVFSGTQDNGVVRGDGSPTWRLVLDGDGGGTAIDPHNPLQVMAQWTQGTLYRITDGGLSGATRIVSPPLVAGEPSDFYARLTASPAVEPRSTVLYPTNRIWATYDWGTSWRVLPNNVVPGTLTNGRLNGTADMITDVVWIAQNRFHVSTRLRVFRYDRTTRHATNSNSDVWATSPAGGLPTAGLPANYRIGALAVANPATDDLYIGLGGANTGADHVWWFDTGTSSWQATGFGPGMMIAGVLTPFDAPVNALLVDPTLTSTLYVGTDVGVFRGVRSAVAPFTWAWTLFSTGLPEAAVHDIKFHQPTNRLRVALHGRGLWEIDLSGAANRSPDVYQRMHGADSGRRRVGTGTSPHPFLAARTVNWTMSPDIKVRRNTTAAQVPPAYPGAQLRFATPRQTGAAVTRWQAHVRRRGFSTGADALNTFDAGCRQAARDVQSRYGLTAITANGESIDGIVGPRTWAGSTSYPPTPTPMTMQGFADLVGEDFDQANDVMIADAAGPNDIHVQVFNRGHLPIVAGSLRVVLLVAASDAAGTVPQLPADYAARIRAGDTTAWLGASGWRFADAATVYRTNPLELNQRRPAYVSWTVDFSTMGMAAGSHALLLTLVSATSAVVGASDNTMQSAQRTVRTLVEGDVLNGGEPKAAARLVRLDAVTVIP